jgi:hypothetical protein
MAYENKRVLVTVRTYPTPALKGIEVSCTAGITDDGKWIRLFPVPYRFLNPDQRFRKYQWIEVEVRKARNDPRPESYNLSIESIQAKSDPLPTINDWQARKDIIFPLKAHCLCCLKNERDAKNHPTLGFFRPKLIQRIFIEPDTPTWTHEQLTRLHQIDLFRKAPQSELEKVPYKFKYEFICDETTCSGHTMMCTDWEMGESWRRWKQDYGDDWEAKFRQRYEQDMIHEFDTHFFVGTVSNHPSEWIIVGLFYPPRPAWLPLFDGVEPA